LTFPEEKKRNHFKNRERKNGREKKTHKKTPRKPRKGFFFLSSNFSLFSKTEKKMKRKEGIKLMDQVSS